MIFTRLVTQANPAAGVGFSVTVPAGENWRIKAMHATLATGAAVANRQPYLVMSLAGSAVYMGGSPVNVPASTTQIFSWGIGGPNSQSVFTTLAHMYLPDLWMPAGSQVQVQTNGIQAADQWSQIWIAVERG